jgi:hypothetical protein
MSATPPLDKEAAPRSRSAASVEPIAPEESHNSSQSQPPVKSGPRLYQLKPICPRFSTIDWIRLRRWQRMKDHERWIYGFVIDARERTFLVTVTFFRFVSDEQAKKAGRRFLQKRLARIVEAYVRVIERQKNGRAHIHFILRVVASAIACGWKLIELTIEWHGATYGFGRCEVELVKSPQKLAAYLVKSLREGARRATGRVVTYSQNIARPKYHEIYAMGGQK